MWFRVDPSSGLPVYRQIIEQVRQAVAGGMLRPGDQLPPVRDLAVELAVNFNTVSKAYAELQRIGLIISQPGRGSFVAPQAPAEEPVARRRAALAAHVDQMLLAAHHLGLNAADVRAVVEARLRAARPQASQEEGNHDDK